jgi:hypothetical protein
MIVQHGVPAANRVMTQNGFTNGVAGDPKVLVPV